MLFGQTFLFPKTSLGLLKKEMRWDLWFGRIIFLHWYYYFGALFIISMLFGHDDVLFGIRISFVYLSKWVGISGYTTFFDCVFSSYFYDN